MICPKCGRHNLETERLCDCGYDLVVGGLARAPAAQPGGPKHADIAKSGCIGLLLLTLPASMLPWAFLVQWGNAISIGGRLSSETKLQMLGPQVVATALVIAIPWLVAVVAIGRAKRPDDPLTLLAIASGILCACLIGFVLF